MFVSYRREDTGPYARLVTDKLSERFPSALVFMDLDSIEPGADFAEAIRLEPGLAQAYFNRGIAHGKLGNTVQADADRRKALELDPDLD